MPDLPNASQLAAAEGILTVGTVYYLSLHTADPGTTGANEVSGGSYARQPITFVASGGNELISGGTDASQSFAGMPAESGNLWAGVWTALSGGTYLWGDPTAAVTGPVAAGATVNFASGAVSAQVT